ncbi:RHS repeat-associated core domain-containing protein [Methanosarcina sp. 2.H.T.1A.3]|uniref:RHS repeat-associated core domain-containing protein n=3 Tax=Methanosarcina TaxID=2207 RepID=UPI000696AAFB|nr:RHS repeat-associated core domain-containing protein [Methanosarcina sp. 2.H.T.1A.3]
MVDETGLEVERTDYFPYGQVRSGGLEKYGFTGQENDADTGLMYYGARYYSPEYRVFVQPDTLLPDPYNPQALNRYSYALNNPVKYTDPSGHYVETALDLAFLAMDINDIRTGNADKWTYIGLGADLVCAALPVVTGGRVAVEAVEETVTHGDELADFFNLMDKVADTEKNLDNIDDSTDIAKTIKEATNVNQNVPEKALDIAKKIKENNGKTPNGYKGGRSFRNDGRNGDQLLPGNVNYKEYDIDPYVRGNNRGSERIVVGDDGSVWYTNDHYKTFSQIEDVEK